MDGGRGVGRVAAGRRPGREAAPARRLGRGAGRRHASGLPGRRGRRPGRGGRPPATAARRRSVRGVPAPVRRGRHARRAGARARGDPAPRPPGAARRQRRRAPARAARARGRPGRRDPGRPPGARGSDARRRLRDRRRQPRRRDLGLEHRDRRGPGRGGAARPPQAPRGRRDPGDGRRLRGRGRRVVVGGARRGDGRRRAARTRERPRWSGARGAGPGRRDPAARRPAPDRRRRVPAVGHGHRRPAGVGEPARRVARTASAGGRMPRWLAESLGISLAAQAATLPDVLATFGRLSLVAPVVNLAVVPLVPVAMLRRAGRDARPAPPRCSARRPAVATLARAAGLGRAPRRSSRSSAPRPRSRSPRSSLPAGRRRGRRGMAPASLVLAGPALIARRPTAGERRARRRLCGAGDPEREARRASRRVGREWRVALVVVALATAIAGAAFGDAIHRETRITVLDVGQGDAILLEARTGARMLIDGGPDPGRRPARARRAHPAVGPPARRPRAHPPARGPRRGPGPDPRAVRGRARLRARDARAGARLGGLGRRAARRAAARRPRRPARGCGSGEMRLAVLWPDPGTVPLEPSRHGDRRSTTCRSCFLGEANGRRFLLMGDVEQGDRPDPARPRPAARRPPQGRPPRERDRDDAGVRRRGAAAGRGRLGRRGQPVRPSGGLDAGPPPRERGARVPDGPGRVRRGRPPERGHRRHGDGPEAGGRGAGDGRARLGSGADRRRRRGRRRAAASTAVSPLPVRDPDPGRVAGVDAARRRPSVAATACRIAPRPSTGGRLGDTQPIRSCP